MVQETSERVWPYVVPFPLDSEKRGLIWSIFQSRVGLEILGRISVDKRTYQHDLMESLPYSNKSIIKYLKKMVKAEVLAQGMEVTTEKGKAVWVKWYKPTSLGKWLVLFLKSPSEVSLDLAKTAIEELFHLYSSSIVEVCQKYGMNIDSFHQDLDKQYLLELAKNQPKTVPEVAVFGSVALDVYGSLSRPPSSDELMYVEETGRYPGGMGANVAVALARLNIPAAFCGRIGSDPTGRMLLENLIRRNVDVSSVRMAGTSSLRTYVLSDNEQHRWLFAVGSPESAISLKSHEEINWEILDHCRVVYIGEVFIEVASALADYAKTRGKIIVYRPGAPYMKFGAENLRRVLQYTTICVLNQMSWKQLRVASKETMESPTDLLSYGLETVILTKGAEGCEVFSAGKQQEFPVTPHLQAKFKTVDPTGAGDAFSAGVIKGLLRGWRLEKAVLYGQTVASIVCSRVGTGNVFPTEGEVEAALGFCDSEKQS